MSFLKSVLRFSFITIITVISIPFIITNYREVKRYLGLLPTSVPVMGTGSMYPSLFWEKSEGGPDDQEHRVIQEYRTSPHMYRYFEGLQLGNQLFFHHTIDFGDMVTFHNQATQDILNKEQVGSGKVGGFIKRVIGLPGDLIEIRDGYVYRNGQRISEPYIYKPRSTYGNSTLPDCHSLKIPSNHYFVLGDNRKISSDSRGELGLIEEKDISFVLPYNEQNQYRQLWRDTSHDNDLAGTPTLDVKEFYRLVNQQRQQAGLKSLTSDLTLELSSQLKAKQLLSGNDSYTLEQSLADAGYSNIVTGELAIKGRFTAQELLSNILYFADSKAQLLDSRYTQIGVVDANQEVDDCPTEVVVIHFGGYVPAKYDQETLQSWQDLINNLKSVLPSWEQAKDNADIDQTKLNELLTIFYRRLDLAKDIVQTMKAHQWLSKEQLAKIEADERDASRSQQLTKDLNQL